MVTWCIGTCLSNRGWHYHLPWASTDLIWACKTSFLTALGQRNILIRIPRHVYIWWTSTNSVWTRHLCFRQLWTKVLGTSSKYIFVQNIPKISHILIFSGNVVFFSHVAAQWWLAYHCAMFSVPQSTPEKRWGKLTVRSKNNASTKNVEFRPLKFSLVP